MILNEVQIMTLLSRQEDLRVFKGGIIGPYTI
jgi:hypothetical protein